MSASASSNKKGRPYPGGPKHIQQPTSITSPCSPPGDQPVKYVNNDIFAICENACCAACNDCCVISYWLIALGRLTLTRSDRLLAVCVDVVCVAVCVAVTSCERPPTAVCVVSTLLYVLLIFVPAVVSAFCNVACAAEVSAGCFSAFTSESSVAKMSVSLVLPVFAGATVKVSPDAGVPEIATVCEPTEMLPPAVYGVGGVTVVDKPVTGSLAETEYELTVVVVGGVPVVVVPKVMV